MKKPGRKRRTPARILTWLSIAVLCGPQPATAQIAMVPHYDSKLMRLAEILGSLHYLRNLCGEKGHQWRDRMNRLIDREKPDARRRARLLNAFNTAYHAFSEQYYECTPSAVEASRRYVNEGAVLSQELVDLYGN